MHPDLEPNLIAMNRNSHLTLSLGVAELEKDKDRKTFL